MAYDRATGAEIVDYLDNLKQQIKESLETVKGTRLKNREFGSELYKLIDKPNAEELGLDFIRMSYEAIVKDVPDVKVKAVLPIFYQNSIDIKVTFAVENSIEEVTAHV